MSDSLRERIERDGLQLDREVALMYRFVQHASEWQGTIRGDEIDGPMLLKKTSEIAALRARICSVLLQDVAMSFRERGSVDMAEKLEDLAMKMGLSALAFAREHGLSWAGEE